mgnify:CR=1 FL=1
MVGAKRQIGLHLRIALRRQFAIDVAMQVDLADGLSAAVESLCHFTIRSFARASVAMS